MTKIVTSREVRISSGEEEKRCANEEARREDRSQAGMRQLCNATDSAYFHTCMPFSILAQAGIQFAPAPDVDQVLCGFEPSHRCSQSVFCSISDGLQ